MDPAILPAKGTNHPPVIIPQIQYSGGTVLGSMGYIMKYPWSSSSSSSSWHTPWIIKYQFIIPDELSHLNNIISIKWWTSSHSSPIVPPFSLPIFPLSDPNDATMRWRLAIPREGHGPCPWRAGSPGSTRWLRRRDASWAKRRRRLMAVACWLI